MPDSLADKTNSHTRAVIVDAATAYIEPDVLIGEGTVIEPNTTIRGSSRIGAGCRIGPNAVLTNAVIGDGCVVFASVISDSTLEEDVHVGPFCHVRGNSHLESGVRLGTSAEVNRSRLGPGTKMNHFAYLGDAEVGRDVNIGAGAVTCNYNGVSKNKTIIEDGAFIGSDSMLVAPVRIGKNAATGAGSVVTKDVDEGTKVAGVPARRVKPVE
jgi:bifunctional UDP-N-acetylglucosamine pyrophosphorylase/glucosamine-1-phosphate N-acetyltransferase